MHQKYQKKIQLSSLLIFYCLCNDLVDRDNERELSLYEDLHHSRCNHQRISVRVTFFIDKFSSTH